MALHASNMASQQSCHPKKTRPRPRQAKRVIVLRNRTSERSQISALQIVSAALLLPVPTKTAPRDRAAREKSSVPTSESATTRESTSDTSSVRKPEPHRCSDALQRRYFCIRHIEMVAQDGESGVHFAAAVAADNASGKESAGADFIFCSIGEDVDDIWAFFNIPKVHEAKNSYGAELAVVFMPVEPEDRMS